jgi:putative transposase
LGQVYRIIERIPEPLKLFADGRRSEFSNKYRITKRLNLEDKLILQADFTPIPMLLKASEGEKNANKSGDVTAYLVEIIEANSRYVFPPIFVTKTPSQLEVAASIRNAMLVIGFFNELWVDRGKQYVSKRIERISKKKNFKLFKCPPRYPQLKGRIERYFRTVETRCWSKLEGYTGPDLTRRNPTAKAKYTVEDLIKIYEEFRSKYNNVEEHSETGQIPAEALQNRPTYFPDMTSEDRAELDLLLKIEENAKILQQGIRYKKHWYYHSDLKDNVGAKVTLFIEPGDGVPQEVRVYLDDQVLCAAVNTTSDEGKILLNEIGNDQRAQTAYYRKRIKEAREREKQDQINSEVINDTHPKGESSEATKLVLGDTIPRKPTKPESQRKIKRFSDIL